MNKNLKKLGIMALVAVVAVGSYFVSGTYAKYTSKISGTDSAQIAKWAWNYKGTAITGDNTISFDLFNTIKDSNGSNETDVVANKIAPGTKGEFSFSFQNLSEVTATYDLVVSATKGAAVADAYIEYSLIGTDAADDWTTDLATLASDNDTLAVGSDAVTETVYWRWSYERGTGDTLTANDAADTAVGFAAGWYNDAETSAADKTITINASVRFTQVD